jgi:hypothetical protein
MIGTVVPKQVYDDGSDYGRLAQAIEANSELLSLGAPFLPDDAGRNRADVDEVQDVRVFPAAEILRDPEAMAELAESGKAVQCGDVIRGVDALRGLRPRL